jgi:hypothetical protein
VNANEEEKRIIPTKFGRTMNGMGITERFLLLNEGEPRRMRSCSSKVGWLIARADDDADSSDPGTQDFFDDNRKRGFDCAIAVHKGLKRQRALIFTGGGDEGLVDIHVGGSIHQGGGESQPERQTPQQFHAAM